MSASPRRRPFAGARILTALLFGALLLLPCACGGSPDDSPAGGAAAPAGIAALKTTSWRNMIGQTVELDGYIKINEDGTAMLVQDPDDTSTNRNIPESRYVALAGDGLRGLDPMTHYMAQVKVTGRVRETTDPDRTPLAGSLGDLALCEIDVTALPDVLVMWPGTRPSLFDICRDTNLCRPLMPIDNEKYAILYSGGISKSMAYMRYWNDMALYYGMLTWVFGYDPDNITVIYKDGVPENGFMPVHYAATPANLNQAFADLGNEMGNDDTFFFFMTNHGGTASDANSTVPGDEDGASDSTDETGFFYNDSTRVGDDDIAALVNSLSFARMCCVMEQCFSGGMCYDLRGPNRVICTACAENEVSWGGAQFDDFVMLFASALIGYHQTDSHTVDADVDNDGKVSIHEAFIWARDQDTRDETPQYEDNGDGASTNAPSPGVTSDGTYGASFFL